MTQEDIITLGDYCEGLMRDDRFNLLCTQVRERAFQAFLSTEQHEHKKRDSIYNETWGLQTFLGMLQGYVSARNEIFAAAKHAEQNQEADETLVL